MKTGTSEKFKNQIYFNFISMTRLEMTVALKVKHFEITTNKPDSH